MHNNRKLLSEGQFEDLAIRKLAKAGKSQAFEMLSSLDASPTKKHLPKLVDFFIETDDLDRIKDYYSRFLNSRLRNVDINQYRLWQSFEDAVDQQRVIEIPADDTINFDVPAVYEDPILKIWIIRNQRDAVILGRGYTFCISDANPTGNAYNGYRYRYGSTFFFIRYKNRSNNNEYNCYSDNYHLIVFEIRQIGDNLPTYAWTPANNGTAEISINEFLKKFPEIKIPWQKGIFKNNPLSVDEVSRYKRVISTQRSQNFKELSYNDKIFYMSLGFSIDDWQWSILDNEQKRFYINFGLYDLSNSQKSGLTSGLVNRYITILDRRLTQKLEAPQSFTFTDDEKSMLKSHLQPDNITKFLSKANSPEKFHKIRTKLQKFDADTYKEFIDNLPKKYNVWMYSTIEFNTLDNTVIPTKYLSLYKKAIPYRLIKKIKRHYDTRNFVSPSISLLEKEWMQNNYASLFPYVKTPSQFINFQSLYFRLFDTIDEIKFFDELPLKLKLYKLTTTKTDLSIPLMEHVMKGPISKYYGKIMDARVIKKTPLIDLGTMGVTYSEDELHNIKNKLEFFVKKFQDIDSFSKFVWGSSKKIGADEIWNFANVSQQKFIIENYKRLGGDHDWNNRFPFPINYKMFKSIQENPDLLHKFKSVILSDLNNRYDNSVVIDYTPRLLNYIEKLAILTYANEMPIVKKFMTVPTKPSERKGLINFIEDLTKFDVKRQELFGKTEEDLNEKANIFSGPLLKQHYDLQHAGTTENIYDTPYQHGWPMQLSLAEIKLLKSKLPPEQQIPEIEDIIISNLFHGDHLTQRCLDPKYKDFVETYLKCIDQVPLITFHTLPRRIKNMVFAEQVVNIANTRMSGPLEGRVLNLSFYNKLKKNEDDVNLLYRAIINFTNQKINEKPSTRIYGYRPNTKIERAVHDSSSMYQEMRRLKYFNKDAFKKFIGDVKRPTNNDNLSKYLTVFAANAEDKNMWNILTESDKKKLVLCCSGIMDGNEERYNLKTRIKEDPILDNFYFKLISKAIRTNNNDSIYPRYFYDSLDYIAENLVRFRKILPLVSNSKFALIAEEYLSKHSFKELIDVVTLPVFQHFASQLDCNIKGTLASGNLISYAINTSSTPFVDILDMVGGPEFISSLPSEIKYAIVSKLYRTYKKTQIKNSSDIKILNRYGLGKTFIEFLHKHHMEYDADIFNDMNPQVHAYILAQKLKKSNIGNLPNLSDPSSDVTQDTITENSTRFLKAFNKMLSLNTNKNFLNKQMILFLNKLPKVCDLDSPYRNPILHCLISDSDYGRREVSGPIIDYFNNDLDFSKIHKGLYPSFITFFMSQDGTNGYTTAFELLNALKIDDDFFTEGIFNIFQSKRGIYKYRTLRTKFIIPMLRRLAVDAPDQFYLAVFDRININLEWQDLYSAFPYEENVYRNVNDISKLNGKFINPFLIQLIKRKIEFKNRHVSNQIEILNAFIKFKQTSKKPKEVTNTTTKTPSETEKEEL